MKRYSRVLSAGCAFGVGALILAFGLVAPRAARADVERIREKALELEQKLNKDTFEVQARAKKPGRNRVYKDFSFLLNKNKVDEVASKEGQDPHAKELRLYLIRSIVGMNLATYVDDLREFEQSATVSQDETQLAYLDVLKKLAVTPKRTERRKMYSWLSPIFETTRVFRDEILDRRNQTYSKWGFSNYAEFYSAQQGIDLDHTAAAAKAFLENTKALYDSLFAVMADRYLQTEPRRVRLYDLPYLAHGSFFDEAFPARDEARRLKAIFKGLGVDLDKESNLRLDTQVRPGKSLGSDVYPLTVPGDVRVSVNPVASMWDDETLAYAVGEAQIYALSKQTAFEPAYLVNDAARAALAYLPRFVVDEPGWIKDMTKGREFDLDAYLAYRAFLNLLEARRLAATAQFEIAAYRGETNLNRLFRTLMKSATGASISSSDSKRSLEALDQLRSASRFSGLLLAASVRQYLRRTFGEDWFQAGKSGSLLRGLWEQGGALRVEDISAACGNVQADDTPYIQDIESLLHRAATGR